MNIWLIQTGELMPLGDAEKKMRTAMLADELVKRGHSVTWWTSSFDHFTKQWIYRETTELQKSARLKFIFLKGTGYKKNFSFQRFRDHRVVASEFYRTAAKKSKPDLILASLPPHDIAYKAAVYARQNNIPFIVDIRDPWPDIFLEHMPAFISFIAKLILFSDFKMSKTVMKYADSLISVTNSFMQWGLAYAGRQISGNDRIFPLGYKRTGLTDTSKVNPKFLELEKSLKEKFIVFFVGTISKSYHNPAILIQVAQMPGENKSIHFVIAGDGELFNELSQRAKDLPNVTFTGWLNQQEIEFFLKIAKVGVCPAPKDVDLPTNKAYAYFAGGLPVISAFEGELKLIIEKHKTGLYYQPGNAQQLKDGILRLFSDKNLYEIMSLNAKKLFDEKFNADRIYEEYANHIEMVKENYIKG